MKLKLIISLTGMLTLCGFSVKPSSDTVKPSSDTVKPSSTTTNEKQESNAWAIGPFIRPADAKPVLTPQPTTFYCPMQKQQMKWEESDTFNPAATVKDGKIIVLYRAEDNSAQGIGKRTSRIGYAESKDGVTMKRLDAPVLFPGGDNFEEIECPGGCEDPRVAMTEDGLYVMIYTAWNRKTARLAVATSRDLKNWTKHGLAFAKAFDGRFTKSAHKSASIVTKIKNGTITIDKVNGKYLMYWGEYAVHAATSDNLIDWYPVLNEKNELLKIATPRKGHFDSVMTECGPPAIRTKDGIVLMYNGKNRANGGDTAYPAGAYCAGQLLLDANDPYKVLGRLDKPFFVPEAPFEKSGQYKDGTVFIEGLVYHKKKLHLYYGCADSMVGVAVCDDTKKLLKVK